MPTYLVHGFRWQRAAIRIHIILQNLDDAAAEWIVAPATSLTLLDSFYRLYDFLPPSHPPQSTATYTSPLPTPTVIPPPPPIPDDTFNPSNDAPPQRRTLSKKNTRSMISLRSISRRHKPPNLPTPSRTPSASTRARSTSTRDSSPPPMTPRPATARYPPPASHSAFMRAPPPRPLTFNDWSAVKLVEQYDPEDYSVSQPYAYVADYIVPVSLGASIAEEMARYEAKMRSEEVPDSPVSAADSPAASMVDGGGMGQGRKARPGWFEKLRDGLQAGGEIGWFVVLCGDEERRVPSMDAVRGASGSERLSLTSDGSESLKVPRSAGFRGFFRRKVVIEE